MQLSRTTKFGAIGALLGGVGPYVLAAALHAVGLTVNPFVLITISTAWLYAVSPFLGLVVPTACALAGASVGVLLARLR